MLVPFFENFEANPVATLKMADGKLLFLAKDLCKPVDMSRSAMRDQVASLDDSDKGVYSIDTLGGPQKMTFVSESGALQIVCQSRKPEARRLRKWICDLAIGYMKGELALVKAPNADATRLDRIEAKLDGIMLGLAAARPRKPRVKKDPPPQSISVLNFHQTQLLRSGAETRAADIFAAYLSYCARNGAKPVSQNLFGRTMNALGLRRRRTRECWLYEDVELIQIGWLSL